MLLFCFQCGRREGNAKPGLARHQGEEQRHQKHRSQLCTQSLPALPGAPPPPQEEAERLLFLTSLWATWERTMGIALRYSDFSTNTPAIGVVFLPSVVSLDQRIHTCVSQERDFYSLKTWIQTRCKLSVCSYI